MAKFMIGARIHNRDTITKNSVQFLCEFILPESARESIPYTEAVTLEGRKWLSNYTDLRIGDTIDFMGHRWHVSGRHHYPYPVGSRGVKQVSKLLFEYVSRTPEEEPD